MRARKIIAVGVVVLTILAGVFLYGFVCSQRRLPPYALTNKLAVWAADQRTIRVVYGVLTGRRKGPDPSDLPGRWQLAKNAPPGAELSDSQKEAMNKLRSIGYLSGYETPAGFENVTTYDPERAYAGFNYYTSGHGEEAIMMDMTGKVLHRWSYHHARAFPGTTGGEFTFPDMWRRVYLFPNGDLIAIYEGFGIIKLDKDSHLIWGVPGGYHHDLEIIADGSVLVLNREARIIPRIHEYEPVLEDLITIVSADGEVLRNVSLLEAFEKSDYASYLDKTRPHGDLLHTNTIEVFDGSQEHRSPLFKQGNVLLSFLEINVIGIVDMETEVVVWALSGQWVAQHQPTLLQSGHLLVFDNRGHNGLSKVVEVDPFTQQIYWAYEGTPENAFLSHNLGSNQRLPNGNTLITESESGRAFELTPDLDIVWEYYNPERAGEDHEFIATLYEVVRLAPDFPTDWVANQP